MNLATYIEKNSKINPSKVALIDDIQKEITYADLWNNVEKYSQFLVSLKIKQGDRVALILPNSAQYFYIFLSLLRINAIISPFRYGSTISEIKNDIKFIKPFYLISDKAFFRKFLNVSNFTSDLPLIVSRKYIHNMMFTDRVISFEKAMNSSHHQYSTIKRALFSTATINLTYRGVGYPLGAVMSHEAYIEGIKLFVHETNINEKDILFLSSPLTYAYSLIANFLSPLSVGATIVIYDSSNSLRIFEIISKHKISFIANVPTFFSFLIKNIDENINALTSLKKIFSGGSKLPRKLYLDYLNKLRLKIYEGYGLTECLPIVSNTLRVNKMQSIGMPSKIFNVEIRILIKDSFKIKSPYVVGEIIIKSGTLMTGYFNNSEMDKRVFKNNWFLTGDIGYFDEDGFLYIINNKKNVIKVGGNMVDLQEVKNAILDYKDVLDVNLFIKEDDLWGNLFDAKLCVKNPDDFNQTHLKKFLRSRLSSYKVPRNITIV